MKPQFFRLPAYLIHFIPHRCRPLANCAAAVIFFLLSHHSASAADHRDAPALTGGEEKPDINDLFIFSDPGDNTQVVLIATVQGFIVPGQGSNEASFASNAIYRFEIYNEHVNLESPVLDPQATRSEKRAFLQKVKPNRLIDVTFSKREVGPEPQTNATGGTIPTELRRPKLQTATVKLQGFRDVNGRPLANHGPFDQGDAGQPLTVSPISSGPIAPGFVIHTIDIAPGQKIQLFAGLTDDPFFADLPALSGFVDSIRNGSPSTAPFARGRDTFAGYNTMAIALRMPAALLQGEQGAKIGVDAVVLQRSIQRLTKTGTKDSGTLRTIDRMGVPLVNTLFIPFDLKDTYNMASVYADGSVRFLSDSILPTLADLGLVIDPPEPSVTELLHLVIAHGDLLQLDLSTPNTGTNIAAAFPNGRRVQDDTVDYVLTRVNHGATLGDNVRGNELPLVFAFPFLAPPHQPLFADEVDDRTRN